MKRFTIILVVLLLAVGILAGTALAGKFSYLSGIQVQNLSGSTANIVVDYYNKDGSSAGSFPDTISPNDDVTYFPVQASTGFDGSVVISSDQPVAAISNILGDSGVASAAYVGSSVGSTNVSLPLLMANNGGFDTWFNVQNTGVTTATVNVSYSDGSSAGPISVAPGAAYTFDQSAETHSQAVFSGVVTSSEPVAVAVIEESSSVLFAYTGFPSGSTDPVMPLVQANNAGFVTGIQIQNIGGSSTDVTVAYTALSGGGSDCTETQTVPAGESKTFALLAFASDSNSFTEDCTAGALFVGSAEVSSNSAGMDLVALVNQLGPASGEAYGGFDRANASSTVVMPLIMDDNAGFFTGFNVQNVGSDSTSVTCTFSGSTYTVSDPSLGSGEPLNDLQFGKISSGYVGSATCTASGGADNLIIGVVNEVGPSSSADQLLVYEGVNN